ncbi:MAG: DUF4153 domain-containing protein [Verrucomicrobiota bacterium]
MKERILEASHSAHELEALYRGSPAEFVRAFPEAFKAAPDSAILQAWQARLFFERATEVGETASRFSARDIWLTAALSILAGMLAKLPQWFPDVNAERFYARNLAGIVAFALITWFCAQRLSRWGSIALALLAIALLDLNFLPDNPKSESIYLALLHAPFFFWSLVGFAFLGGAWKNLPGRMNYLRYNGELLVYTTVVLLGGVVLTWITLALFQMIDVKIEDWYMKYVVVYGAIASPIVATLLVEKVVGDRFKIAPLLAKVFTPLFLVTGVAYLGAMALKQKSLFTDREFLIAFNVLLLVVLGICIFSISERGARDSAGAMDWMNIGLVAVTLTIDAVALAAILFRVSTYGFSPNRIAVLGANLLVFVHLAGILLHYLRFAGKTHGFENLEKWIAGYLPAYTAWSLVVVIGFPLAFRFR